MPAFPQVTPPLGQMVAVTLANGATIQGYFDGLQWWVGVPDQAEDIPLVNSFVVSWTLDQ